MAHEERIRRLMFKYKIIGFIVSNHALLESIAFLFNIAINVLIVASYSEYYFTYNSEIENLTYSD
jgi:hypothetical protein